MEKEFRRPVDILRYMSYYYLYGWKDKNNRYHLGSINKEEYQTMSLEEIVENRIGNTIEQAQYFKYYLDKMDIPNKMFCIIKDAEILYCFTLYEENEFIYHLEHVDKHRKGIYEYTSYKIAIDSILRNLKAEGTVIEIPFLPEGVEYQELVNYIKCLKDTQKSLVFEKSKPY